LKLINKDGQVSLPEVNKRLDNTITQELIKKITDKGYLTSEDIESRIVDTSHILNSGKWKVTDYMKAVEFTSYRLAGDSQVEAYRKTFPERCSTKKNNTILASASIYNSGKLVQHLIGMAQIPLHLLYMRERHAAIRRLAGLIETSMSERIQMEASDKLLTHIKGPEEFKFELDLGIGANDTIAELTDSLNSIAAMAKKKLDDGTIDAKQLIQR
jgi:hypothetical protein